MYSFYNIPLLSSFKPLSDFVSKAIHPILNIWLQSHKFALLVISSSRIFHLFVATRGFRAIIEIPFSISRYCQSGFPMECFSWDVDEMFMLLSSLTPHRSLSPPENRNMHLLIILTWYMGQIAFFVQQLEVLSLGLY